MTHRTDCTVLDEARDDVDRVAQLYWDSKKNQAENLADSLGWEHIGGGVGRSVWRVTSTEQVPTDEGVTEEWPCVVKFAIPGGHHNGLRQNSEELNQFKLFPPEITDADPPIVVPIKDWDRDSRRPQWLSAPEVDANGGWVDEVQRRLIEAGWGCHDLHHENVGEMHDTSVLLDYGLECFEATPAADKAEDIAHALEREDAEVLTVETHRDGATISFMQPEWIGGADGPQEPSKIFLDRIRGPQHMELRFGMWPADQRPRIEAAVERITEDLEDDWWLAHVFPDVRDVGSKVLVDFEVRIEARDPNEGWTEFEVRNLYETIVDGFDEHVGEGDPREFLREIRLAVQEDGVGVSGDGIELRGANAEWSFYPPDDAPGKRRPANVSWLRVDNDGFVELMANFGPWRGDEPLIDRATAKADDVTEVVQRQFPDQEVRWNRFDAQGTTGEERVEIAFFASPSDAPGAEDLTADEIARLYRTIYEAVKEHMPRARQTGEPVQDTLPDVEAAIGGAIREVLHR